MACHRGTGQGGSEERREVGPAIDVAVKYPAYCESAQSRCLIQRVLSDYEDEDERMALRSGTGHRCEPDPETRTILPRDAYLAIRV